VTSGRIVEGLQDIEPAPSVVSIGFFDGVHRGHQSIIRRAVDAARTQELRSVVVTFDRHPMEVVNPGSQPQLLMTLARRARTLAEQDVDLVVVLPFDDDVRHWSADAFVDHVLVDALQARNVVVGDNFRFGHKAAGNLATLNELGPGRGFTAEGVALLKVDGVVVRGDQRGAGLGYPTANLQVSRRVAVPARGIYAGAFSSPDGHQNPCVTSVGVNPTFGGQQLRIEAYLLDFSGDLYGDLVAVDFRHRLRAEERFGSVAALVTQIDADVAEARRLLAP